MKDFFLNSTRIVEKNARIYWSIIFGLALCMMLFVAEAVHVQNLLTVLNTTDQNVMREAIEPLAQRYRYSRYVIIILAVVWSSYEFTSTKRKLGL